ncbi:unnamed protein product, partial [Allacma fusca]
DSSDFTFGQIRPGMSWIITRGCFEETHVE